MTTTKSRAKPHEHKIRVFLQVRVAKGPRRGHRPVRWHELAVVQSVQLEVGKVVKMNPITLNPGHTAALSILFLDQNGNPMLATPVPDSPPVWTNTAPAVDTLTVVTGGLSATDLAIAEGTDVISLSVIVGGKTYAATLPITVVTAPQVLTSVQIASTIS